MNIFCMQFIIAAKKQPKFSDRTPNENIVNDGGGEWPNPKEVPQRKAANVKTKRRKDQTTKICRQASDLI